MRHLVKDITSSLNLKPDIVTVPKKSRRKGLKTSRAELLVPFKRFFNDKANASNKATSVAFYTLLVYNHGRCLQNKMCSSLWNVLPAACRATILKLLSVTPFPAIWDFYSKIFWPLSEQNVGLIHLLLFTFPFTDFFKTQRNSVISEIDRRMKFITILLTTCMVTKLTFSANQSTVSIVCCRFHDFPLVVRAIFITCGFINSLIRMRLIMILFPRCNFVILPPSSARN